MKLCYIDYPVKMTLGGMKYFKQATGGDLWSVLMSFIKTHIECRQQKLGELQLMEALYSVMDFETASHVFKAIIDKEERKPSLEELQDAMFRSGWRPGENTTEDNLPWPLVMISAAYEIDNQLTNMTETDKKKADTSEQ